MTDKQQYEINIEIQPAPDAKQQAKIYWHVAFYNAIQLSFVDYFHQLEFTDEYYLSKQPLRMDVLIIKKDTELTIDKNIGRIFESHNIIEFKSESDSLTINDYTKVMGYANLYSSFEEIPIKDITVSFIAKIYPRNLLKYLRED